MSLSVGIASMPSIGLSQLIVGLAYCSACPANAVSDFFGKGISVAAASS